jgi:hypothetical protein
MTPIITEIDEETGESEVVYAGTEDETNAFIAEILETPSES